MLNDSTKFSETPSTLVVRTRPDETELIQLCRLLAPLGVKDLHITGEGDVPVWEYPCALIAEVGPIQLQES